MDPLTGQWWVPIEIQERVTPAGCGIGTCDYPVGVVRNSYLARVDPSLAPANRAIISAVSTPVQSAPSVALPVTAQLQPGWVPGSASELDIYSPGAATATATVPLSYGCDASICELQATIPAAANIAPGLLVWRAFLRPEDTSQLETLLVGVVQISP
jgi:hypothetical protein